MKPVRVLQLILTLGLCTGPLAAQPVPSQDSAFVDADFVGDGSRCVSVSRSGEITIWDLNNGKKLKSLSRSPCLSFAVSPDGRRVACGGWEGEIAIIDLGTGQEVRSLATDDKRPVGIVVWSPDAKHLISTDKEKSVHLWDVPARKKSRMFTLGQPLGCLAVSPDGKAALLGPALRGDPKRAEDFAVKLLDLQTGAIRRSFPGHQAGVSCVGFSPDGTLALAASSDTVLIWDVATGAAKRKLKLGASTNPALLVYSAAFTPDSSKLLTAGMGQPIRIVDVATGKDVVRCESAGQPSWFRAAMSPDRKRVLGLVNSNLVLWDAVTGEEVLTLAGATINRRPAITWLLPRPRSHTLLAGNVAASADLWDYHRGTIVRSFSDDAARIAWAAFTPDGERLLSSDENGGRGPFFQKGSHLRLWDVSQAKVRKSFPQELTFDSPLDVSPSGDLAAVSAPGVLRLIDLRDGRTRGTLKLAGAGRIAHPAFTPDGLHILAWAGGPVQAWRLRDDKSIRSLPEESVSSAAVSPDSRLLLTAGQRLALWELHTGKLLRVFSRKEDGGMYLAVAFSPDGAQFLSGRSDGVVQLWNPRTGEVLRQFVGKGVSNHPVSSVVFLDEGRLAASGHDDGVIRIWDVATGKEIRQLKKLR